jgi:hypothetical protein
MSNPTETVTRKDSVWIRIEDAADQHQLAGDGPAGTALVIGDRVGGVSLHAEHGHLAEDVVAQPVEESQILGCGSDSRQNGPLFSGILHITSEREFDFYATGLWRKGGGREAKNAWSLSYRARTANLMTRTAGRRPEPRTNRSRTATRTQGEGICFLTKDRPTEVEGLTFLVPGLSVIAEPVRGVLSGACA